MRTHTQTHMKSSSQWFSPHGHHNEEALHWLYQPETVQHFSFSTLPQDSVDKQETNSVEGRSLVTEATTRHTENVFLPAALHYPTALYFFSAERLLWILLLISEAGFHLQLAARNMMVFEFSTQWHHLKTTHLASALRSCWLTLWWSCSLDRK